VKNGIVVFPNGQIYIDQEWIDANKSKEKPIYYKCQMLNHGWCVKCYKPSVAKLVLKRGMYLKIMEMN